MDTYPRQKGRDTRRWPAWLGLGLLLAIWAAPTWGDEERERLVQLAREQIEIGRLSGAETNLLNAEKQGSGPCGECRLGLAMVYLRTGELKKGEKSARAAVEQLKGHASEATAYGQLGKICLQRAGKASKKKDAIGCAESAFRQALELPGGETGENLFYLGLSLLKRSEDPQGVAHLEAFLERYPEHPLVDSARGLIRKPVRARKPMAPDFRFKTLQGEVLTSEGVEGRVVLFDFWATWCAPCRAALPKLKTIAKRHEDDPFELISVSVDSDEFLLRDFIDKEKMTWPQVWDRQGAFNRNMSVSRYPTYVLVDGEGEIVYRISGGSEAIEKKLGREVARHVKAAKKKKQ